MKLKKISLRTSYSPWMNARSVTKSGKHTKKTLIIRFSAAPKSDFERKLNIVSVTSAGDYSVSSALLIVLSSRRLDSVSLSTWLLSPLTNLIANCFERGPPTSPNYGHWLRFPGWPACAKCPVRKVVVRRLATAAEPRTSWARGCCSTTTRTQTRWEDVTRTKLLSHFSSVIPKLDSIAQRL